MIKQLAAIGGCAALAVAFSLPSSQAFAQACPPGQAPNADGICVPLEPAAGPEDLEPAAGGGPAATGPSPNEGGFFQEGEQNEGSGNGSVLPGGTGGAST